MTRQQVADHYCVDQSTIRKPSPGSKFARLRVVRLHDRTGGAVRYLRSDVEALDRELLKAAMTPYGKKGAGEETSDE